MSGGLMNHGRLFGVCGTLLFATFSVVAQAKQFPAVAGEYVVKLKSPAHSNSVTAIESSLGAHVKSTVNSKEGVILVVRSMVESRESAVQELSQNPIVEYAEPNFIYKALGGSNSLPSDPELTRLWGMINTGQSTGGNGGNIKGVEGIDIDAKRAWGIETGSKDIVVAVIDTGVNYKIADLAPNIFQNIAELNGQPNVDDDGNGFVDDVNGWDFSKKSSDPMDVFGHGTHCAGTIGAAGNNKEGVTGVAWNVQILPIRFLGDDGSGTLADAIASIDYATKMKVHVMSNSWGGGGFSQSLMDSIKRAKEAGILFVAAAGNDSNDNDSSPSYPASYDLDNIISVAAIDPTGALADFSNFGSKSVHIAAPGVNILSYTMNGLESWSGTSMATPHVSGVAALLFSQDSKQSYSTIRQRLLASARPLASLRGRVSTGMLNAYYALTNQVAPVDPNDPFSWQKSAENISTSHPYASSTRAEWKVQVPGAKRISVFFSKFETEGGYDKVTFTDSTGKVVGTLSGKLGEAFSPVIEGDSVTINFVSDGSVNHYGFDITGIAYQ